MRINILTIISGLILLYGCIGKQIDCPSFNEEVLEWIPYAENDSILLFNSTDSAFLTLTINEIFVEHTTHYMTNEDCGTCDDFIEINDYHEQENNIHINIHLYENHIESEGYTIFDSKFSDYYSNKYNESDYLINGITYDNVKIFENDVSNDLFSKLVLAKGFGIISLTDKEGNIWILNQSVLKSGETEKTVEINNISCG